MASVTLVSVIKFYLKMVKGRGRGGGASSGGKIQQCNTVNSYPPCSFMNKIFLINKCISFIHKLKILISPLKVYTTYSVYSM